jgi:dUTPase
MLLLVKKLNPDAKLPIRNDCDYELYALESGTIQPGERKAVGTGISVIVPSIGGIDVQYGLVVSLRSKHIEVLSDQIDDNGNIMLYNYNDYTFSFERHECIAQLFIQLCVTPDIEEHFDYDTSIGRILHWLYKWLLR